MQALMAARARALSKSPGERVRRRRRTTYVSSVRNITSPHIGARSRFFKRPEDPDERAIGDREPGARRRGSSPRVRLHAGSVQTQDARWAAAQVTIARVPVTTEPSSVTRTGTSSRSERLIATRPPARRLGPNSGRAVGSGPGHDRARARDHRAVVGDQNRDVLLPGQIEDLLSFATAAEGQVLEPAHDLDLVSLAGPVQRLSRDPTRMLDQGRVRAVSA